MYVRMYVYFFVFIYIPPTDGKGLPISGTSKSFEGPVRNSVCLGAVRNTVVIIEMNWLLKKFGTVHLQFSTISFCCCKTEFVFILLS